MPTFLHPRSSFPKHDFAQPALGVGEPQGEVKVSVLRTIVQVSEPPPGLTKSSGMTLSSELVFSAARGGPASEPQLDKG